MDKTETNVTPLKQIPTPRCSDYDEDCQFVKSPSKCWCGEHVEGGVADGYCPMMFNYKSA